MYLHTACSSRTNDAEAASRPPDTAAVESAVRSADELFRQRSDTEKLKQAVQTLSRARTPDHRNFEVEWRYSKYSYFLGKALSGDESDSAFEAGRDAGEVASMAEPNKADGYFWYGANLGELSRKSPFTVGLKSVDDIKRAMNKVIEIQPDYQNSSAFDALAQVEIATRLSGGKPSVAIELLEKALTSEKNNTNLRLTLAEAYLAEDRKDDARQQLELLFKMKANPDYIPEYNECISKARKLMDTRF
ncbi:MAG: tetratricopeptide repeat protein [Acidobacteriota bacterium]